MNVTNFIMGILAFILGLLLVIMPAKLLTIIVVLLGAASVVFGLLDIIKVRVLLADQTYRLTVLIKGIVSIVIGILAICLPIGFADTVVTVMMYIMGVYLVLCAVADLFQVKKLKDDGSECKQIIFQAIGTLVAGIIMFMLPADTLRDIVLRIVGIVFMAGGAAFSFYTWKERPIVVEAENVRDDDGTEGEESTSSDEE